VWTGERLTYNFKTRRASGESFKTGQAPFFARGGALAADTAAGVYVLADGLVTTDDYAEPGYSVRAKTFVIVPGNYIEAENARLYLGNTPVFWFPKYRRSLQRHRGYWTLTPGYRSSQGAYLLTSYNWYWNERFEAALNLDGRTERGVGVGPDFRYHLPRFGDGTARYYYTHDDDPGSDDAGPINSDRHRVWFQHLGTLRTNLTLRSAVRYQSDSLVVRDFYESEYRDNTQPSTFAELNQSWPNAVLNVYVQARVNDFQETVERLPEVRFTVLPWQIGRTPLYYDSESSGGYYRRRFAFDATNDFSAVRLDTFHQVRLPWTFFNWLNVTPRVGGRFTYYSQADGPGVTDSEMERAVFNTGVEVSTKASRVWPGVRSRFWDLQGLRHILQPSVNYVYVPEPGVRPPELPQFDYELPTTRLLPILYPDYNAIDAIDSQNVLRLGLRNRLQTKRSGQVEDFFHWGLYTDWRLDPRPGQGTFSDLYSDFDLDPFRWLTLSSELRYGLDEGEWREANHAVTLRPNSAWSATVGHRFLRDTPELGPDSGNNLLYSSIYFRLGENWAARLLHYYEIDDHTLQEQQYTLYRDFRSWTGAFTFRVRDSGTGELDYAGAFTFSLKAFPRYALGEDVNKPTRLLGD
jgi:lipopolysaccharide assembly outer membrane protein LptD (OstA)